MTRSVIPTRSWRSTWSGSRGRVIRPAARAAGQNRLPGSGEAHPGVRRVPARVETDHEHAHRSVHGVGQRPFAAGLDDQRRAVAARTGRRSRCPRTPRPRSPTGSRDRRPQREPSPGEVVAGQRVVVLVTVEERQPDGRADPQRPVQIPQRERDLRPGEVHVALRGPGRAQRARAGTAAPAGRRALATPPARTTAPWSGTRRWHRPRPSGEPERGEVPAGPTTEIDDRSVVGSEAVRRSRVRRRSARAVAPTRRRAARRRRASGQPPVRRACSLRIPPNQRPGSSTFVRR